MLNFEISNWGTVVFLGLMYAIAMTLSLLAYEICTKWKVFDAHITANFIHLGMICLVANFKQSVV